MREALSPLTASLKFPFQNTHLVSKDADLQRILPGKVLATVEHQHGHSLSRQPITHPGNWMNRAVVKATGPRFKILFHHILAVQPRHVACCL